MKLKSFLRWLAIGFIVFLGFPTDSYVLQGAHVLDLMEERLGSADTLYLLQKQIIYPETAPASPGDCADGSCTEPEVSQTPDMPDMWEMQQADAREIRAPEEPMVVPEAVRYVFSRAFRSELESQGARRIQVYSGGQTLTVVDGTRVPEARTRFDWYKDLLLYRQRPKLIDHLSKLGVDVSVTSLGRFEEHIAFVLGAIYPDETVSQVWIDKETFWPLRWIVPGPAGGGVDTIDIRYIEWRDLGSIFYPMRIEFFQNGQLIRAIDAERYEVDASFSSDLFDIDRLRAEYPPPEAAPSTPGTGEGMSDIQKAIEDFKRLFD